MAQYTDQEMKDYLESLRRQYGTLTHSRVVKPGKVPNPNYDPDIDDDSEKYVQGDVKAWVAPNGYRIEAIQLPDGSWDVQSDEPPDPSKGPTAKSEDQRRQERATADKSEAELRRDQQLDNERSYNQSVGRGFVTHAEYAAERARQEAEADRKAAQERQRGIDERTAKQQEAANQLNQEQLAEQRRHNQETEKGRPAVVGSPKDTDKSVAVFDPNTGKLAAQANPAYDEIKDKAEQERQRIATEIAQRRMSLDEGIQGYTEWFNNNVKVPFMQAEEERARAKEQREALDAEERRRQFASQFKLQKAELGEKAGEAAAQQEIALLPYRAGPEEAQHMSDAINGLAAGGTPGGPSAGAGIHFSGADFQFDRPDFKAIAAAATQQAIGHLTDYKPSGQSYGVGNYSGVTLPNAATMASAPSAVGAYQPPAPQIPIDSDQP